MPWSAPTSPGLQNGVPKDPWELLIVCSQPKYARSIICTYASKMDFILQQMGGQQFSATLTSGFENPIPLNPHWFIIIFFQKKKTLWSKSPPFFSHNQRFFCACTQKDLNPVLRLRPRPKHQLGGVEGIDQHHLTAQVFNGFWMFLGTEIGRFFIEIWGNQNGGTLK